MRAASLLLLAAAVVADLPVSADVGQSSDAGQLSHHGGGYKTVQWEWSYVQTPYVIAIWLLMASVAKILFHFSQRLSSVVPESCVLILLGLGLGGAVLVASQKPLYQLDPGLFFLFLLPTIVADAGYFMPSRLFFENLGPILMYAVLGTLWNACCTGLCLYGMKAADVIGPDVEARMMEFLLFGALISAVDPVAVLAVFEGVQVNETLFVIVFGESLLNDAVTVVLYKVYISFVEVGVENVQIADYFKGLASFLIVSLGGTLVGLIFGMVLAFVTRFTKKVRIIEPLFVFLLVYLAYLTAELFSLSAILSMIFCGIGCNKYVEANISQKSRTTVKYTMKTLASIAETIIFIFLGISAVDKSNWAWDSGLISCTLIFILVFRAMGVIMQTWLLNRFRLVPLDGIDQVVMSYGGLRGAVAFALVALLDRDQVKAKDYFMATTIVVIFFTVMFQAFDHTLTAVEDIAGLSGYHHWRDKWEQFDKKFLSKLLMRKSVYRKAELWEVYQKINLRDAITIIDQGGNVFSAARLSLPSIASRPSFPEVTDMTNYLRENGSGVCLDLPAVDPVPGPTVDEESETHNVLTGNLYKPRRRVQAHYSRHFMTTGESERQEREVFQRNMRGRLEFFKSTCYRSKSRYRKIQKRRKGSDISERDGSDKPMRKVSWQDTAAVAVDCEEGKSENAEPAKEGDGGITVVARESDELPGERPRSVPAALEVCGSPPPLTSGERPLPWKGSGGALPVCVSMEATKLIPVDLQQAWNQSTSSLESLAPPPPEPLHPRVTALCREEGVPARGGRGGGAGGGPGRKQEGAQSPEQQEMQPLLPPPPPLPPIPPAQGMAGRGPSCSGSPCGIMRSLVTAPPPGGEEPSGGATQL